MDIKQGFWARSLNLFDARKRSWTMEEFELYAEKVKSLTVCSNEDLLILYGLFKQGTIGNVNTSRPGMLDMKGKAKWDAWKANEGKSQDDAMRDYITKAKQLLEANGLPA